MQPPAARRRWHWDMADAGDSVVVCWTITYAGLVLEYAWLWLVNCAQRIALSATIKFFSP